MERPPLTSNVQVESPPPVLDTTPMIDDMPLDMLRHFDMDVVSVDNKQKQFLNDIHEWVKSDLEYQGKEPTRGNVALRVQELKRVLGVPLAGETMLNKVWRWLKLQRNIDDLQKEQTALKA